MNIKARIEGINYAAHLCKELKIFNFRDLDKAISSDTTFILEIDEKNRIALSWWVSAKRTRSYPYARVYDSLSFVGKKLTIIPIVKDEGKDGDRDFLQWDTISLMSLLDIYVIIAYYSDAIPNSTYANKITKQRFDIDYLKNQIRNLLTYQSDALHWNLSQVDGAAEIGLRAIDNYDKISQKLGIEMHSKELAIKRINELKKGKESFIKFSRELAERAQKREVLTIQPKENIEGTKGIITITNYLGGNYYFTVDEVKLRENNLYLIEAKHTKKNALPSLEDIKDGLLKMILFTNLKDVEIDNKKVDPIPILKLTGWNNIFTTKLTQKQKKILKDLVKESHDNGFKILINNSFLDNISKDFLLLDCKC